MTIDELEARRRAKAVPLHPIDQALHLLDEIGKDMNRMRRHAQRDRNPIRIWANCSSMDLAGVVVTMVTWQVFVRPITIWTVVWHYNAVSWSRIFAWYYFTWKDRRDV